MRRTQAVNKPTVEGTELVKPVEAA